MISERLGHEKIEIPLANSVHAIPELQQAAFEAMFAGVSRRADKP